MDIEPPPMALLVILGELIIPDTQDITIDAGSIQVVGKLSAGSVNNPFQHKLTFIIRGISSMEDF